MKGWEKDGVGPSGYQYKLGNQRYSGAFCHKPSCWSDCDVRPVKQEDKPDAILCRYHRKHYIGGSS